MRLHDLKNVKGARHRRKRIGCGESSGHGKTSGRGNKGQKARSGGAIRPGFEGGQMPLYRRLPKKGFSNAMFRNVTAVVNVGDLNDHFEDGAVVSEDSLRQAGLVKGRYDVVKVLGTGELTRKLTFEVSGISASAKEKIEKAGGTVTVKA
ncbi:MAG TPA: 50S ribosomal protein L15 [Candidatus Saccharimonadia bacterium]|nr:50S ribosomal protein L15 [Candidatus Saccharimonadia bacterium]